MAKRKYPEVTMTEQTRAGLEKMLHARNRRKVGDSTTPQKCNLDLAKFTQEYFYFDILNADVDTIKIPTIRELAFLGNLSVSNIRRYFRGEEIKLLKWREDLKFEIEKLRNVEARLEGDSRCDWRGYNYGVPSPEEVVTEGYSANHEAYRQKEAMIGSCQFGRDVAHWCERIPAAHCNHHCIDHEALMTLTPTTTGEIDKLADELMRLDLAQFLQIDAGGYKCQFYDLCYGAQPLLDETCVLVDPEQQAECLKFLQAKLADVKKRTEILKKYLHNLTRVIQKCDSRYERLEFFDGDNYCGSGSMGTLAIIYRTLDGIAVKPGLRCETEPDLKGNRPILISELTDDGIELVEIDRLCDDASKIYMPLNDFMYLLKNREYREVWLTMSDFKAKAFSKEELAGLFALGDEVDWDWR